MFACSISGCVYKNPEPNDPRRPNAIAANPRSLRVWQIQAMLPQLIGLPIYVNHKINIELRDPVTNERISANRQGAISGTRPLGRITHAWTHLDALYWSGTLEFHPEDSELLAIYKMGMLTECSLQHGISDMYASHVITPLEISICFKGERPGSFIYRGGDTAAYMRANGYISNNNTLMSFPAIDVPAEVNAMIRAAARITALEEQIAANNAAAAADAAVAAALKAENVQLRTLIDDNTADQRAAMAGRLAVYGSLCEQFVPGFTNSPVCVMASADKLQSASEFRDFSTKLETAISLLMQAQQAKAKVTPFQNNQVCL